MYIIQSKDQFPEKVRSFLEDEQQKGNVKSFKEISKNRFLVLGEKPKDIDLFYVSNVYWNDKKEMIIIYPRIAIMFKNGVNIQSILDKSVVILNEGKNFGQSFILKCNVTDA